MRWCLLLPAAIGVSVVTFHAQAQCPAPGEPGTSVVLTACGHTEVLLMCSDPAQSYEPHHDVAACALSPTDPPRATAAGSHGHGIQTLAIPGCGVDVAVPNDSVMTPGLAITAAPKILDGLFTLCEQAKGIGVSLPKATVLRPGKAGGGPYVVSEDDVELALGGLSVSSLEVHGMLIVLGPIEVSGKAVIDGLVLTDGAFGITADEIEVRSRDVAGFRVGGLVAGGKLRARKATIDRGVVLARPILPIGQGEIAVTESLFATGARVDADAGIFAVPSGGLPAPVTLLAGTSLRAKKVEAGAVAATDASIDTLESLTSTTLALTRTVVAGAPKLDVVSTVDAKLVETHVTTGHLVAGFATASVDAKSSIDASERGGDGVLMPFGETPVVVIGELELHAGGSYGAYGGTHGWLATNSFAPAPPPIGDPRDPDLVGMGKGGFGITLPEEPKPGEEDPRGGKGGGWIQITAGSLRWDGSARVDGGSAATGNLRGGGGGGTGGSIRVLVKGALEGAGTFHANGGDGSQSASPDVTFLAGGGGSGGRIAIRAASLAGWKGRGEAVGGLGGRFTEKTSIVDYWIPPWWDHRNHGGPGTVYVREGDRGTIEIDGLGLPSSAHPCPNGPAPRCRGMGVLTGDFPDDDVVLKNAIVVTDGLRARSIKLVGARLVGDNPRVRTPWPSPTGYDGPYGASNFDVHQWQVPLDVWMTPNEERVRVETSGDLEIDAASAIDLTGQGGYGRVEGLPYGGFNWAGGSHGGKGGRGRLGTLAATGVPSATFGDPDAPTDVGLGGLASHGDEVTPHAVWDLAGEGGGALRVVVGGTARVDGELRSDGLPGRVGDGTAAGAGGSVWLTCAKLVGSGEISASGAAGKRIEQGATEAWIVGGGGGGGRVAVACDVSGWKGKARADGGGDIVAGLPSELTRGEPGTVRIAATTAPPAAAGDDDGGGCAVTRRSAGLGATLGPLALWGLGRWRRRRKGMAADKD